MFCKKVRLGNDATVGTTQNGKTMMKLSGAYDVGFGQNKQTQWISLVKFGDNVANTAQHLTKGKEIVIYADDIQAKEHNGKAYLNGVLRSFEFCSGGDNNGSQAGYQQAPQAGGYQQAPAPQQNYQQAPQQSQQAGGFDGFDDEIGF